MTSVEDLRPLAEVVHLLLIPLYERFNIYQPSRQVVQRELREMQRGRM